MAAPWSGADKTAKVAELPDDSVRKSRTICANLKQFNNLRVAFTFKSVDLCLTMRNPG